MPTLSNILSAQFDNDGWITLYFTQQDFNDYNTLNTKKLPLNEKDIAGISNLRVTKKIGNFNDKSGIYDSYQSANAETVNPDDNLIVWNPTIKAWEVTVKVADFNGGFFVHAN